MQTNEGTSEIIPFLHAVYALFFVLRLFIYFIAWLFYCKPFSFSIAHSYDLFVFLFSLLYSSLFLIVKSNSVNARTFVFGVNHLNVSRDFEGKVPKLVSNPKRIVQRKKNWKLQQQQQQQ